MQKGKSEMFTKFMAYLLLMLISFAISICVMIRGWGLTPHSWGWIIFGLIWTVVAMVIREGIEEETKK